jgi:hypothetical protein
VGEEGTSRQSVSESAVRPRPALVMIEGIAKSDRQILIDR